MNIFLMQCQKELFKIASIVRNTDGRNKLMESEKVQLVEMKGMSASERMMMMMVIITDGK